MSNTVSTTIESIQGALRDIKAKTRELEQRLELEREKCEIPLSENRRLQELLFDLRREVK